MPSTLTHPGLYVEEIPSGVRPITGVSTSNTAFIDYFATGPMGVATRVTSFTDFTRRFGGLDPLSPASYAILQYFLNGGSVAWVVRVAGGTPAPANTTLPGGSPPQDALIVSAANPGKWGNEVQVAVDWITQPAGGFNLVVRRVSKIRGRDTVVAMEVFRNLNFVVNDPQNAIGVVKNGSNLVSLKSTALGGVPAFTGASATDSVTAAGVVADPASAAFVALSNADSVTQPGAAELIAGLAALDAISPEVFNLMCIPRAAELDGTDITDTHVLNAVATAATQYCEQKRAFFLVDIPAGIQTVDQMTAWMGKNDGLRNRNAAVSFPRLSISDPLRPGQLVDIASSGTIAGVYARTDSERGVWKAPAGTDAQLRNAGLAVPSIDDGGNDAINPLGINALRTFPVYGNVVWGARTLDGADIQASEWKYVPVRRMALYIEESLVHGLAWVVFEPNDEPLWSEIRLNVGAFMHTLFRKGAFQGATPKEAYLVKCDHETTTQADVDLGIVNVLVGFAALKPAEFVVLQLTQLAGQTSA